MIYVNVFQQDLDRRYHTRRNNLPFLTKTLIVLSSYHIVFLDKVIESYRMFYKTMSYILF